MYSYNNMLYNNENETVYIPIRINIKNIILKQATQENNVIPFK